MSSQSEQSPGPGSYKIKTTSLRNGKKISKKAKKTSFGTETKRKSLFDNNEHSPGPADYDAKISATIEHQTIVKNQESRNAYGRVIPKSSSMFLSSVARNASYVKENY